MIRPAKVNNKRIKKWGIFQLNNRGINPNVIKIAIKSKANQTFLG